MNTGTRTIDFHFPLGATTHRTDGCLFCRTESLGGTLRAERTARHRALSISGRKIRGRHGIRRAAAPVKQYSFCLKPGELPLRAASATPPKPLLQSRHRRDVDDILYRTAPRKIVRGLSQTLKHRSNGPRTCQPSPSACRQCFRSAGPGRSRYWPSLAQGFSAPWIPRSREPGPRPPAVLRPRQELRLARLDRGDRLTDSIQRGMLGAALGRKRKKCHAGFGFQEGPRVSRSIQCDVGELRDRGKGTTAQSANMRAISRQNHQKKTRHN